MTAANPAQTWNDLRTRLAGSFTASVRGLFAGEIYLSGPEGEFAVVRPRGLSGAEITAGPMKASIERDAGSRHLMLMDDETTLEARPVDRSADALEIKCGGRVYRAGVSFLRNTAKAVSPQGKEIVRIEGNLTGRGYEAFFDEREDCALPTAIFLLYHVTAHRGRAFRA